MLSGKIGSQKVKESDLDNLTEVRVVVPFPSRGPSSTSSCYGSTTSHECIRCGCNTFAICYKQDYTFLASMLAALMPAHLHDCPLYPAT